MVDTKRPTGIEGARASASEDAEAAPFEGAVFPDDAGPARFFWLEALNR